MIKMCIDKQQIRFAVCAVIALCAHQELNFFQCVSLARTVLERTSFPFSNVASLVYVSLSIFLPVGFSLVLIKKPSNGIVSRSFFSMPLAIGVLISFYAKTIFLNVGTIAILAMNLQSVQLFLVSGKISARLDSFTTRAEFLGYALGTHGELRNSWLWKETLSSLPTWTGFRHSRPIRLNRPVVVGHLAI